MRIMIFQLSNNVFFIDAPLEEQSRDNIEQVDLSVSGDANGACEWSIELPLKKGKEQAPLRGLLGTVNK